MRKRIFSDENARLDLEAILHPRIGAETRRLADATTGPYQIIVVPLLVGSPLAQFVDRILVSLHRKPAAKRASRSLTTLFAMMEAWMKRLCWLLLWTRSIDVSLRVHVGSNYRLECLDIGLINPSTSQDALCLYIQLRPRQIREIQGLVKETASGQVRGHCHCARSARSRL